MAQLKFSLWEIVAVKWQKVPAGRSPAREYAQAYKLASCRNLNRQDLASKTLSFDWLVNPRRYRELNDGRIPNHTKE